MRSEKLLQTKRSKSVKQKKQQELITVILLCDSPGYRMKSYGPLSLIEIQNTKLIDLQIQTIRSVFKNVEIIICVGFDAEKICKHIQSKYLATYIRVVENQIFNTSNSCESLRLCLNNTLNKRILICDGNLVLNPHSLQSIDTNRSCALFENNPSENLEIGFNKDDSEIIQHFSYGAKYIWSEICFLHGKDVIESLRKILINYDSKTRFMFEAINELIKMKHEIRAISNPNKLIKVNNIKTYHSIRNTP